MRFAATNWALLCCEVAHVCQNHFCNCEIPCGIGFLVRNQALPLRNAFRSCQMRAPVLWSGTPVLWSGTRVPNSLSQLRKFSQRIPMCCGMVWQQSALFAEVFLRLRSLAEPCFYSVFALFLLRFLPDLFFFQFLCIFFHLRSFKKIKTHIKTWFKIKN